MILCGYCRAALPMASTTNGQVCVSELLLARPTGANTCICLKSMMATDQPVLNTHHRCTDVLCLRVQVVQARHNNTMTV